MKTGALLICLFIMALPTKSHALCAVCSCTMASTGVAFGNYLPTASDSSAGQVGITCVLIGLASPATVAYTITLSTGTGSFATRQMASGANRLNYNLYTSSADTFIWGDGTGGTSTISDSYLLSVLTLKSYPVYGLIPAGQNAAAGSYSDTITVTITY